MEIRVTLQWTTTAKEALRPLPTKVRRGLLSKADELLDGGDPREFCKALKGPLEGCYRIVYSRYRAVFTVEEERIVNGDVILHLTIRFIAAGIRKERDKKDVYRVAEKLVRMMLNDGETLGGVSDVSDLN